MDEKASLVLFQRKYRVVKQRVGSSAFRMQHEYRYVPNEEESWSQKMWKKLCEAGLVDDYDDDDDDYEPNNYGDNAYKYNNYADYDYKYNYDDYYTEPEIARVHQRYRTRTN